MKTLDAVKPEKSEPLLAVNGLARYFKKKRRFLFSSQRLVRAVDGISFMLQPGETLGLVGESGCGKSTVGRLILGMDQPSAGTIHFQGRNLQRISSEKKRNLSRDMQMIFQDPLDALDPRMNVASQVREPLDIHDIAKPKERTERVDEILGAVGLPLETKTRFPHEFSGGQQQRIVVARALILKPKLIVCDEPVSAMDVSIQAQVLNLLTELRAQFNLTYFFISHDLKVVRHISNRIAVMYLGKIVEIGERKAIFDNPLHPYTQALISAIPVPDPHAERKRIVLKGDPPSPVNPPCGCRFHTRCPFVMGICKEREPRLQLQGRLHEAACHLLDSTA